jgi:predicted unusual protein kinase regulating ubiquinone biosynthesis (AarF/ABC1/UbiB family)
MTLNVSELIAALPEETEESPTPGVGGIADPLSHVSRQPVPTGRVWRMATLGTLQAKIAAAYLFYWLRGWFANSDVKERMLAETHWRTAVRVLNSMSYLRGAVMKVGQTLANFPEIAPREFVETLERLHFEAPPMHWSLLREMVHNELDDDPETLFSHFEREAFAAASLGQVHHAQLKTGEEVAVKIQYPGIARSIESDFQNLFLFLLPHRLAKDWENIRIQFADLQSRLELETDYTLEANNLERARNLFHDHDGIVVPQVFPKYSTNRILTMERLDGMHLHEFLTHDPSQEERNELGRKLIRACYRLMYAGRMLYVDFHPGNLLVQPDGRLGLIDFGSIIPLVDDEWEIFRKADRPMTTGSREDRIAFLRSSQGIGEDETDYLHILEQFGDSFWESRYCNGEFDFGDEVGFRRGYDLFLEMCRKRYTRARPNTMTHARSMFAWRSIIFQLKARIDVREIAEEEIHATGWDRSEYAT